MEKQISAMSHKLAYSNDCPTHQEREMILTLSKALKNAIALLELDMGKASSCSGDSLSLLCHPICLLQTELQNFSGFLTPVRRLPPELLTRIFMFALDDATLDSDPISYMQRVLLLCHICSRWRQIAIWFPRLWSNLGIVFEKRSLSGQMQLLDDWLVRSQDLPLSIVMQGKSTSNSAVTQALVPHSSKISTLNLDLLEPALSPILHPPCALLSLKELHLTVHRHRKPGQLPEGHCLWQEGAFSRVPSLRRLTLFYHEAFDILNLHVPWSQLVYICISPVFVSLNVFSVLAQCVNLEQCILGLARGPDDINNGPHQHMFALPKLRKLQLCCTSSSQSANFFQNVTLPSLKDLELDFSQCSGFPFYMVTPPTTNVLQTITLKRAAFIDGQHFDDFLASIDRTCIKTLELIEVTNITDDFFYWLEDYEVNNPPFPNLETLVIWDVSGFTEQVAVHMVESRWWTDSDPNFRALDHISTLHKVSIRPYHGWKDDTALERLRKCRNEGMDLDF